MRVVHNRQELDPATGQRRHSARPYTVTQSGWGMSNWLSFGKAPRIIGADLRATSALAAANVSILPFPARTDTAYSGHESQVLAEGVEEVLGSARMVVIPCLW